MSATRGIFETFANQAPSSAAPASPFAVATPAEALPPRSAVASPFAVAQPAAAAPRKASPFTVVSDELATDPQRGNRLPERRKPDESPFQVTEPQGFGFEAPTQARPASPFGTTPQQVPLQASPFTMEAPPAAAAAAPTPFGGWPQAEASPRQEPAPFQHFQPVQVAPPQAFAPAPPAPAPAAHHEYQPDSFSIKQIELRAIFGVDREMTHDEILQRARSLPGIRQICRVSQADIAAVDALKVVIGNLGFGSGPLKLYSGSVPIEFIREGALMLAVQTDGGFAPGVRETLILVSRELAK